VLAVALAILLALYAEDRWGDLIAAGPRPPANVSLTILCGIRMLPFAGAMAFWGIAGPGTTGPAGMNSLAQRTVLIVTSVAAAPGFVAPLLTRGSVLRSRAAAVATWVGCVTAALQGPAGLALAHDGNVSALGIAIAIVGPTAATIYGLAVLWKHPPRRRLKFTTGRGALRSEFEVKRLRVTGRLETATWSPASASSTRAG
jgi:hypothetical protein